jgi:transcriptional regulator with XRE-family HTH domain
MPSDPAFLKRRPRVSHSAILKLYTAMREHAVGFKPLADKSGIDHRSIRSWTEGKAPSIANFEAALNALDLGIVVVNKNIAEMLQRQYVEEFEKLFTEHRVALEDALEETEL